MPAPTTDFLGLSSMSLPIISRYLFYLPVELWSIVFLYVAFGQDPSTRPFYSARCTLLLVCRSWCSTAMSVPELWSTVLVDPDSTDAGVSAMLTRTAVHPYRVVIRQDMDRPSAPFRSPDSVMRNIISLLHALLPSVSRWSSFDMHASHLPTIDQITALLLDLDAPVLRSLRISSHCWSISPGDAVILQGALVFRGQLSRLRHLSLFVVPLPWASVRPMPALTHLTLESIRASAFPTYRQYIDMFTAAPALEFLVLRGLGCSMLPSAPVPFSFPSVRTLGFSLGVTAAPISASFVHLLKSFFFPRLCYLDILFHPSSTQVPVPITDLRFACKHVRLAGRHVNIDSMRALYPSFVGVETLDLRGADVEILEGLAPASRSFVAPRIDERWRVLPMLTAPSVAPNQSVILPFLTVLKVTIAHWHELRFVLELRQIIGSNRVQVLHCHIVPEPAGGDVGDAGVDHRAVVLSLVDAVEWVDKHPGIVTIHR
ncbi:hypothetical protein B0H17DRAFT_1123921 [Mycena rosella]|uniref:F-box domain-containing protein n=1 Tax=Mycena rosella TaxID=1033263 RepID=A0AAD7MD91_MYCRO|nr:hypothetical protein B0H17DRAFT_1123921 [Mycena rosella]